MRTMRCSSTPPGCTVLANAPPAPAGHRASPAYRVFDERCHYLNLCLLLLLMTSPWPWLLFAVGGIGGRWWRDFERKDGDRQVCKARTGTGGRR